MKVYGVLDKNDGYIEDVSKSLRGAKIYATRHGFEIVSVRIEYDVIAVYKKINNKWVEIDLLNIER